MKSNIPSLQTSSFFTARPDSVQPNWRFRWRAFTLTGLVVFLICWVALTNLSHATNIRVSNTRIIPVTESTSQIQFDLTWDFSWRVTSLNGVTVTNWDAAWVFAKYRVTTVYGGDNIWRHVWLSTTAADHTVGNTNSVPFTLSVGTGEAGGSTRGMGVFMHRSATAAANGTNNWQNVRLLWNHAQQGHNRQLQVEVQVFAIEMVYVAPGTFSAGSGGTEDGAFRQGGAGNSPFSITTQASVTLGDATGQLWGNSTSGTSTIGPAGSTHANYPTGVNAFYMMKTEISQGMYRDFLNTLTRTQQLNRILTDGQVGRYAGGGVWNGTSFSTEQNNLTAPANRIGLRLVSDPGGSNPLVFACDLTTSTDLLPSTLNLSNDGEWIAMAQLNFGDFAAFADWAALRPMTELEYEKAGRGPATPVANEYAWGSTSITRSNGFTNAGTSNEVTNTTNANIASNNQPNVQGPKRAGSFARTISTRVLSGASFWGILDLSGNVWEPVVSIGHTTGRNFQGTHGDGQLSADGHADALTWPGMVSGVVTGSVGWGVRGGYWAFDPADTARLSSRLFANQENYGTGRLSDWGGRAVRTAP